jgi:hypothetical protein
MYPRRRSLSTSSNVTFVLGDSGSSGNASADEEDRGVDATTQTEESHLEKDADQSPAVVSGPKRNAAGMDVASESVRPIERLLQILTSEEVESRNISLFVPACSTNVLRIILPT